MSPEAVASKKAELDERLKGGGSAIITKAFGLSLWNALCRSGDITLDEFPNAAFGLEVPGAEPMLFLPAYGKSGRVCAKHSGHLPIDAFSVGDGGHDA